MLERLTLAARARARREAYAALTADLAPNQRRQLDGLLDARGESRQTHLGWVRRAVGAASPNTIRAGIERLKYLRALGIPLE